MYRSDYAAAVNANDRADRIILPGDDQSVVQDKRKMSNRLRTKVRTTLERFDTAHMRVALIEEELEIEKRWSPGDAEYKSTAEDLHLRKYCLALDNLERLVIQHMFELTKLGMSSLGMSSLL